MSNKIQEKYLVLKGRSGMGNRIGAFLDRFRANHRAGQNIGPSNPDHCSDGAACGPTCRLVPDGTPGAPEPLLGRVDRSGLAGTDPRRAISNVQGSRLGANAHARAWPHLRSVLVVESRVEHVFD